MFLHFSEKTRLSEEYRSVGDQNVIWNRGAQAVYLDVFYVQRVETSSGICYVSMESAYLFYDMFAYTGIIAEQQK